MNILQQPVPAGRPSNETVLLLELVCIHEKAGCVLAQWVVCLPLAGVGEGHIAAVSAVAFSRRGPKFMVSGGADKLLKVPCNTGSMHAAANQELQAASQWPDACGAEHMLVMIAGVGPCCGAGCSQQFR